MLRHRQELSFVTFRCQVELSQFTAQDQRRQQRKVNNLDMRATLIVAASPSDRTYISTHVIMMRRTRESARGKRVGAIRLFWTRHPRTNEMDSGHTRSISVSTSSQYVLDHTLDVDQERRRSRRGPKATNRAHRLLARKASNSDWLHGSESAHDNEQFVLMKNTL